MKTCTQCGAMNPDEASACSNCGAMLAAAGPVAPGAPPQQMPRAAVQAPNDSMAVASLVCGIVSFFFCALIGGILAVVFGGIAKRNIAESGGTLGGEGLATAGVIMGWINIGLSILAGIIVLIVVLAVR